MTYFTYFRFFFCTVCYCFTSRNNGVSKEHVPPLVQTSMGFPLQLTWKAALFPDTKDQCPAQVNRLHASMWTPLPEEYNNRRTSFPLALIQKKSLTKQGFSLKRNKTWNASLLYIFLNIVMRHQWNKSHACDRSPERGLLCKVLQLTEGQTGQILYVFTHLLQNKCLIITNQRHFAFISCAFLHSSYTDHTCIRRIIISITNAH